MNTAPETKPIVTTEEAAHRLSVGPGTIRTWFHRSSRGASIPRTVPSQELVTAAFKVGTCWAWRREVFDSILLVHQQPTGETSRPAP